MSSLFCVNKKEKESGRKKDFSAKRIFLPKNKTLRGKIKKFVVGREKRTRKRKRKRKRKESLLILAESRKGCDADLQRKRSDGQLLAPRQIVDQEGRKSVENRSFYNTP